MIEIMSQAEQALGMGLLDRAERFYREIVEADPHSAAAVTGLARVAIERRDDAGALVLAWRALAMAPHDAVAVRLVQRLEEVLAERGEALPARGEALPARGEAMPERGEARPGREAVR